MTININDVDMTTAGSPTTSARNGYPVQDTTVNYRGVYVLYYWVPLSELDAASASLSGANFTNTITGPGGAIFDPTSGGGQSNYGTGSEPIWNNVSDNAYNN